MSISEALLPEFDQEMDGARRTLERVPEDRFDWKPHARSGSMIWLAGHLANIPYWATLTIQEDELDLMPDGKPLPQPPAPTSVDQMLAEFDQHVREARASIAGADDAAFLLPWSLLKNGVTIFSMPKIAVLRSFVMNHLIHHRAQLGVYLRLNDIPVPALYGPSADENPPGM
ncbi:MAG: DinB family protein [Acidobacteriota bacterium]|nr:DinB family protein [Acidobacteriota bacterium]